MRIRDGGCQRILKGIAGGDIALRLSAYLW